VSLQIIILSLPHECPREDSRYYFGKDQACNIVTMIDPDGLIQGECVTGTPDWQNNSRGELAFGWKCDKSKSQSDCFKVG
jgi:hypothetical protein